MIKYFKKIGLIVFSYLPSEIKIGFYRMIGAAIGRGCYIGLGSYILPYYSGFSKVQIGENTTIGDNVTIIAGEIIIGCNSEIKDNTKITGETSFRVGNNSYVGENTIINLRREVEIGNEAGVGANCSLYTHGVWLPALDGYPAKFGKIIIKDRAWVAANVFIMPGVVISEKAVVGSGSVVTKSVPANTFVAGNPAKEIRKIEVGELSEEEKNRCAKDMISEFIERFRERTEVLEESSKKIRAIISFTERKLLFIPKTETIHLIYTNELNEKIWEDMRARQVDNVLVISFDLKKEVKEKLVKQGVSWIDLKNRTYRVKSGITNSLMIKSLKNNGLRLARETI